MLFNHINHLQVQHNSPNSTSTIPSTKSSQCLSSSSLSSPPSNPPLLPENDKPVEHRRRPTLKRKRVNEGSNKEALLAANRRSGKKCRYRKMIILKELQESVSKLSKQQSELIQQNAILKKERDILRQVEKEEEKELQFFPPVQFPIHPVAVSLPEVEEPQPSYNENLQQTHNFITNPKSADDINFARFPYASYLEYPSTIFPGNEFKQRNHWLLLTALPDSNRSMCFMNDVRPILNDFSP